MATNGSEQHMYEVIEAASGNVVSTHPTYRKAFNAACKLEPNADTMPRDGWRYLVRRARSSVRAEGF